MTSKGPGAVLGFSKTAVTPPKYPVWERNANPKLRHAGAGPFPSTTAATRLSLLTFPAGAAFNKYSASCKVRSRSSLFFSKQGLVSDFLLGGEKIVGLSVKAP